jgi:hypothetical protein
MSDDETRAALLKVMDFAAKLDLHGVMILSPNCPDCGHAHDFKLCSDLDEHDMTVKLLMHFAMVAWRSPDDLIIEARLQ